MTDSKEVLTTDKPEVKKKAKTSGGCPFDKNYPVERWKVMTEGERAAYRYALEQSEHGRNVITESEK